MIHYGLTPVVGGYFKCESCSINLPGSRKDYPKRIVEIVDTGSSARGRPPLVRDARKDNLWFLRRRSGTFGRKPGTGKYGIVDPEDLQALEWNDYFLCYLADDPETAVRNYAAKHSDSAHRAQRYLDHLAVQRLLKIEDPNERFEKLLPYYVKRVTYGMKSEAREGIISCGRTAGEKLVPLFKDPKHKHLRPDIITIWGKIRYKEIVPLLADLLRKHDEFWAKQNLEKGWWNKKVGSDLTRQRRKIYTEVYRAVCTLRVFQDPRAKEALELTSRRWKSIKFENPQIAEECEAALKAFSQE